MNKFIFFLLLSLFLSNCVAIDTLRNGFEHSQAVELDLEKSIGQKPLISFNWTNGSLTDLTVTFTSIPKDKSLKQIYELTKQSITNEFKQQPQQIIISFVIAQ
ncbi:hypothetical protein [Nostoc sp. C117]|uniref:hypothetical protein n=1 Tax=Nostoc sp. C117 TaxID=3349875 RepID=UPI00370D2153